MLNPFFSVKHMRHNDSAHAEVVLYMLVSRFTFEMSDKEILCNIGSVWYPTIGRESNILELPLKVSLYKS